jgi:Flp pilus assembly protein TadG
MRRRSSRGQSLVEFMLVITFLFIVFVSIIQTVLLMYAYTTFANSAKEGVRYAIVHGTGNTNCSGPGTTGPPAVTCSDTTGAIVQAAVVNFAGLSFQNIQASNVTVDYNPNGANGTACNVPGCLVRVTVAYQYQPLFGFSWPSFMLYAAADGRIMN